MIEQYESLNEKELADLTAQKIRDHAIAKARFYAAESEADREKVLAEYPDFQRGRLPRTPARIALDTLRRQYQSGIELVDPEIVSRCEKIILACPDIEDTAEICFHVSRLRDAAWIDAEEKIAQSDQWAYFYASQVLRSRFPKGEDTIRASEFYFDRYTAKFGRGESE